MLTDEKQNDAVAKENDSKEERKSKVKKTTARMSTGGRAPRRYAQNILARKMPKAKGKKSVAKTAVKVTSPAASLPPPNLLSLPFVVQKHLLQFFDVKSLESLSSTCSFYDQMIAGSNLLALDFPLTMSMLEEIRNTDEIQKKPLLKLNCKKSKKSEELPKYFRQDGAPWSENFISAHDLASMARSHAEIKYFVAVQLAPFSVQQVRELDLVPESLGQDRTTLVSQSLTSYINLDFHLLQYLTR